MSSPATSFLCACWTVSSSGLEDLVPEQQSAQMAHQELWPERTAVEAGTKAPQEHSLSELRLRAPLSGSVYTVTDHGSASTILYFPLFKVNLKQN